MKLAHNTVIGRQAKEAIDQPTIAERVKQIQQLLCSIADDLEGKPWHSPATVRSLSREVAIAAAEHRPWLCSDDTLFYVKSGYHGRWCRHMRRVLIANGFLKATAKRTRLQVEKLVDRVSSQLTREGKQAKKSERQVCEEIARFWKVAEFLAAEDRRSS